MAEIDELIGQKRNDTLSTAIQLRRHALAQGCNLRDPHVPYVPPRCDAVQAQHEIEVGSWLMQGDRIDIVNPCSSVFIRGSCRFVFTRVHPWFFVGSVCSWF